MASPRVNPASSDSPAQQRRLQQHRQSLLQQRATLVAERRAHAASIAAADAQIDALDAELTSVLTAAPVSSTDTASVSRTAAKKAPTRRASAAKVAASTPATSKRASAKKAPVKKAAMKKVAAAASAKKAVPAVATSTAKARPGGTSDKIAALLAKKPSKTLSPTEITEATGINASLTATTLRRMIERGVIRKVGKGAYQIA